MRATACSGSSSAPTTTSSSPSACESSSHGYARSSRRATSDAEQPAQRVGAVEIDRRTRRVTVDEREVALTPKEFDLLSLLGQDPGAVVSREQIMDEVWDPHWYGPTRTLDVHVASLRKKLGDPGLIETVRSVGFRLRDS